MWCGGFTPTSEDGDFLYEAEHRTTDPRAFYCKVAGAQHRPAALADKRFDHGSLVLLRPEPGNEFDPNAVGVWDATGKVQVGYVPSTLSAEVAAVIRSGTPLGGQVIREFRLNSSRGKRIGLHLIIAPVGPVSFVIDDGTE
ncbi:MAG TPA: HIRAN domain-containing protein [Solirubrobacteraceae bacterium]